MYHGVALNVYNNTSSVDQRYYQMVYGNVVLANEQMLV